MRGKLIQFIGFAMLVAATATTPMVSAYAGDRDPLFINLTSDDGHRINMAFNFGGNQQSRGHKLTIFMNDRSVFAVSKNQKERYAEQQKAIQELLDKGVTILVCPMCMKHYGVSEADLLPGLKVSNPEAVGGALFEDNTKTMTW